MNSLISKLSKEVKLSEFEISSILANAPAKYKVYNIPKRTTGYRVIAHPEKRLKSLQRAFLNTSSFPIHETAMAYVSGKSIKNNALAHVSGQYLLKMDFANFFGSITPTLFWNCWEKKWRLPKQEEQLLVTQLLFWKDLARPESLRLSIGAPTSPMISNFCMYDFDVRIAAICKELNVTYTRYADDITFSTNVAGLLFDFPKKVKELLFSTFGTKISLNYNKTKFSSKKHNRHVTGITITNDEKISLGRDRKRYIKHLIHQYTIYRLEQEDLPHLKGLLSFAADIEPRFIEALKKKYSNDVLDRILRHE